MTLTDLRHDAWTPIAHRVNQGARDAWHWLIPVAERGTLTMAREQGALLTAQARGADGVVRLVARRVAR